MINFRHRTLNVLEVNLLELFVIDELELVHSSLHLLGRDAGLLKQQVFGGVLHGVHAHAELELALRSLRQILLHSRLRRCKSHLNLSLNLEHLDGLFSGDQLCVGRVNSHDGVVAHLNQHLLTFAILKVGSNGLLEDFRRATKCLQYRNQMLLDRLLLHLHDGSDAALVLLLVAVVQRQSAAGRQRLSLGHDLLG